MNIHDRQIELLKHVNGARTAAKHSAAEAHLRSWRDGVADALGWSDAQCGRFIIAADHYYLDQGIDRDMCGGVWLDWEAAE